jgi:hypothetical protein
MRFSPARFNAHLRKIGQQFAWRRAFACPCQRPGEESPAPNCPLCLGKGVQWDVEQEGWAGMTSQNSKKGMADFGVWEAGDCVLTIPENSPLYDAGRFDRIRAKNSTNQFMDVLRRGFTDRLVGAIVSIDRVLWTNDAGTAVVEGGIPTVAPNGALTWASGAPPEGRHYSISGVRYDEYYVYPNLPTDRMAHGGARLPRKLLARRLDLFAR